MCDFNRGLRLDRRLRLNRGLRARRIGSPTAQAAISGFGAAICAVTGTAGNPATTAH
jgi:hypothetical protein